MTDYFVTISLYHKSFNFTDASVCYKQKWKLATFNLAHPVDDFKWVYHGNTLGPQLLNQFVFLTQIMPAAKA